MKLFVCGDGSISTQNHVGSQSALKGSFLGCPLAIELLIDRYTPHQLAFCKLQCSGSQPTLEGPFLG